MERQALEDAGFTPDQIEAMLDVFSLRHHTHDIDDVAGLEEALEDACGEDEDDEDD